MSFSELNNDGSDRYDREGRENLIRRVRDTFSRGDAPEVFPDSELLEEIVDRCIEENALKEALLLCDHWKIFAPFDVSVWLRLGIVLNGLERPEAALEALARAETLHPGEVELRIHRGMSYHLLGDTERAVKELEKGIATDPENPDLLFNYALALQQIDRVDEALGIFRTLTTQPEHAVDAWYEIGYCYDLLGEYIKAIESYDRHLDLDPYNANARYNRGIAESRLGMLRRANDSYDMALAISEKFSDALYNKGNNLAALGYLDSAIACYEEVLALEPGDASLWNNLGIAYEEAGAFQKGVDAFRTAITFDESHYGAWFGLGCCQDAIDRFSEALDSFDHAATIHQEDPELWMARGDLLFNMGRYRESLESYSNALELDPTDPDIWTSIAGSYLALLEYKHAEDGYLKAIELSPDWGRAWYGYACVHYLLGNDEESARALQKSEELVPGLLRAFSLEFPDARSSRPLRLLFQKENLLPE